MTFDHYFAWKNNDWREKHYRQPCRVAAYGRMNSILVVFETGEKAVTSRNAVRPGKPPEPKPAKTKRSQPTLF